MITAITWPEAVVIVAALASATVVLAVLVWAIFRTSQIAIRNEIGEHRPPDLHGGRGARDTQAGEGQL